MRTRRILFGLWLALLAGCASVTFKRGASPDAMAADEQACRKASTDDAAYVGCMRDRGWFVAGRSAAPDSSATVPPVTEPQAPHDAPGAAVTPAPRAASTAAPPTAGAPTEASTPPARRWWKFGGNASVAPATAAAPTKAYDPLARINTGSWWKVGGNASDLDRAIDACVHDLGPAHQPDPGATVVTAALQVCLRAAGWHALTGSALR